MGFKTFSSPRSWILRNSDIKWNMIKSFGYSVPPKIMMGLWKPYLGDRMHPGDVFQLSMSDALGYWMLCPCVQRIEGTFGTQWVPSVKRLGFCHLAGCGWVRGAGYCHISDSHEFGQSQEQYCLATWYNCSSPGISCPVWVVFPSTFFTCKVSSSIVCPEWFIYGVLIL